MASNSCYHHEQLKPLQVKYSDFCLKFTSLSGNINLHCYSLLNDWNDHEYRETSAAIDIICTCHNFLANYYKRLLLLKQLFIPLTITLSNLSSPVLCNQEILLSDSSKYLWVILDSRIFWRKNHEWVFSLLNLIFGSLV